jgi:membrane-associated phospholipid phosphatase
VGLAVLVSLLFMMNMLTILEVHYTVDVAAGLVFAFFFHRLAGKVVYYWDWVLNLPYLLVNKGIQRYRRKAIVETNLT